MGGEHRSLNQAPMGRSGAGGGVLGGKKDVCGSGPRGTRQGQFLLRSLVRKAECVPEDGDQEGSWQELCEQTWLRGGER